MVLFMIVRDFGILPDSFVLPVSVLILIFEFVFGLMLLFDFGVRFASLFLIMMVLSFSFVLIFVKLNGYEGGCGCFGRIVEREVNALSFLENLFLICGLIFVNLKTKRREEK